MTLTDALQWLAIFLLLIVNYFQHGTNRALIATAALQNARWQKFHEDQS